MKKKRYLLVNLIDPQCFIFHSILLVSFSGGIENKLFAFEQKKKKMEIAIKCHLLLVVKFTKFNSPMVCYVPLLTITFLINELAAPLQI